jgi:hypothetical protein
VSVADEQGRSKLILECAYLNAERGLRHPQTSCGAAEMQLLGNRQKIPKLAQIHP